MRGNEDFGCDLSIYRCRDFDGMSFCFDLGADANDSEEANHINIWINPIDKATTQRVTLLLSKQEAKKTIRILEAMVKMLEDNGD